MKKILLSMCCLLILPNLSFSQILNAGFENWTNGDPDNWSTSNIPGSVTNVSSNTDAHSGALSARGEVVTYLGSSYQPLLSNTTTALAGSGVDHRVVNLTMWVKFHSVGNDAMYILTTLTKSPSTPIGAISITIPSDVTEWSELILPYKYLDPLNVPDTMNVAFSIVGKPGPNPNVGSWFEVDDNAYSDVSSGVHSSIVRPFDLSIFPNPMHQDATIHLTIGSTEVISLSLFDVAGREIVPLISRSFSPGSYLIPLQREGLVSGMYFLRMAGPDKILTIPVAIAD